MAPNKKFSKEQIVDIAFEIARVEGIDSISIRKVAEKLGSSIAPIYVNFKNVDELINAVIKKIINLSQQLIEEQNTGDRFYDIGVASIKFAKNYNVLFTDLVLKRNSYIKSYGGEIDPIFINEMKKDSEFYNFTEEDLKDILLKMKIFQVGLSVMIANDLLPEEFDQVKALELLKNNAKDIITAAHTYKKEL